MSNTDFNPATNLTQELPPEAEGAVQYLVCALAGREYGLHLATLQEVLRFNQTAVAPVPNTPGWLEGIFSLRGTIISVVNLRAFLGLPPDEENLSRASQAAICSAHSSSKGAFASTSGWPIYRTKANDAVRTGNTGTSGLRSWATSTRT